MALRIPPDMLRQLHSSMKRYIVESFDADAGDLKARFMVQLLPARAPFWPRT